MKKFMLLTAPLFLFASMLKAQTDNDAAQQKYSEAMEQANTSKQYLTYGLIILVSVGLLRIGAYFYTRNKGK
jgi:hypothetical protein